MSETHKGFAILNEVDQGTFARFVKWAYNGYYTAAGFSLEKDKQEAVPAAVETENQDGGEKKYELDLPPPPVVDEYGPLDKYEPFDPFNDARGVREKKKISKASVQTSTKKALAESFVTHKNTVRTSSITIQPPRKNRTSSEDYTEVFLSHARLYVFAELYDIQALRHLALVELHTTLATFELYKNRTGDIITLLRYVYANTAEAKNGVEDMRAMLTHYVGFEMDVLMEDEGFRDLLIEDGGALLGDFMKMVKERIS